MADTTFAAEYAAINRLGVPATRGVRIMHSRMLNPVTSAGNTTYEALIEVRAPFLGIAPILAAGQTSAADAASPAYIVWATVVPNATKAASDAATWVQCLMATSTFAPATAINRRAWHLGNGLTRLASVERDDGGTGYLVLIRAQLAAGSVVIAGNGSDSFTNWATRSEGYTYRWREQPGSYTASNQAGFTSTTNTSRSPIIGVSYQPRDGRVINTLGLGDSNGAGYGAYISENHMLLAGEALTASTGVPHEHSDLAWAGHASAAIATGVTDTMAALTASAGFKFDVAHLSSATQNDWAQGPTASEITAATISTMEQRLATARDTLARAGVPVIRSTWQASTARNWGTSDSLRRDFDTRLRGTMRGDIVVDLASVLDGAPDGTTGQAALKPAYDQDTAHFNRAGHQACAPLSARAIAMVAPAPRGMLIA